MIARELGVSVQKVCLWRKRIAQQGAQGIREGERSGRPPRITHEARLQSSWGFCRINAEKVKLEVDENALAAR
ncbi:helix-turn-helix domain-containing protein [Paraburkholderia sp. SIMBA_030]|uniref:helix-turn-helix domain-containing protein n=1 Tax=Paraburkholderia sp. SIMBA_030 TaxID=3085773 RepID=UPI00397CFC89